MTESKSILLIGDSISVGYTPFVAELMAQQAKVSRIPPNGGDSANVLANLEAWLAAGAWDVVHFNCGLHDLRYCPEREAYQVPLERYSENLLGIIAQLKCHTSAQLVWATTTPVVEERHNTSKPFHRFTKDVDAYNAAALDVVRAAQIAVDDLHAAVCNMGVERAVCGDGVHMEQRAYKELAGAVRDSVAKLL